MAYGHIPLLIGIVLLLMGKRVHFRIQRNGSRMPKLSIEFWSERPERHRHERHAEQSRHQEEHHEDHKQLGA